MRKDAKLFFKGLLIGNPVDKSISHVTHNALLKRCCIQGIYEKRNILEENFDKEMRFFRHLDYRWIAVTMPYKEKVISYVDSLSEEASFIQAVNLISLEKGGWIGHNTDGIGALNAIERIEKVQGMECIILGAGGTAKAIAYEAKKRGALVSIYNRTEERGRLLARQLKVRHIEHIPQKYDCMVNATSVGMAPYTEVLPISREKLCKRAILLDSIYSPRKTALIQAGEEKGCRVVLGEEMFIELSHAQFKIVLPKQIPLSLVRETVKRAILTRSL